MFFSYLYQDNPISKHSIVLDLDETLVHSFSEEDSLQYLRDLKIYSTPDLLDVRSRMYVLSTPNPTIGDYIYIWGIKRPFLYEFIKFCFSYFAVVAVWSAGQTQYVHSVINNIFAHTRSPHIVYSMNECEFEGFNYFKPLNKMIENEKNYNLSLQHTFFLDDREHNFIKNPHNGIIIPPYSPKLSIESIRQPDYILPQLQKWFMSPHVLGCTDIRDLDKSEIFTTQYSEFPKAQFNDVISSLNEPIRG